MTAINRAEQLAVSKPHDHDAENCNTSSNPSLNNIIEARMSRRGVFRAAVGWRVDWKLSASRAAADQRPR